MPRREKKRKQRACLAPAGAADSEVPPPPPILALPTGVLRQILAQHPLDTRLGTFSLVCSAFAAAAAEATTSILIFDNRRLKQRHYDSLAAWLRKHASSAPLQQLMVAGYGRRTRSFPIPWQQLHGLRVLKLAGSSRVLPCGSMWKLSGLTALTELDLRDAVCSSSSGSSRQIVTRDQAGAQQEQAERLPRRPETASGAATASELAHTLPRLPALVSLSLAGDNAGAILPALTAAATPVTGVNALQQQLAALRLSRAACISPELIAALSATLTRLELHALAPGETPTEYQLPEQTQEGVWEITDRFRVSQGSTPRLGQLTQLQHLDLHGIGLDGSEPGRLTGLFSALTQLTGFGINADQALVETKHGDATGRPELAEFLSAVECLTSLRSLEMTGVFVCMFDSDDEEEWYEEHGEPFADSNAPLTAGLVSASLTRLYLKYITLPLGCGPHMFGRPGLRLPHLAELHLVGRPVCMGERLYCLYRFLTADDVASIVRCVEGGCLRELTLKGVLKQWGPEVDWGGLSALTTLTHLSVDTSAIGVEQLTGLVELHVGCTEVPDKTLVAVATQLTRLTCFSAFSVALSARAEQLEADYGLEFGEGMRYTYMPPEECEGLGEEGVSVCEQLVRDLRAVGVLRRPAKRKHKAAGR